MIWVFFIVVAVIVVAYLAALLLGRASYDPMPEPVRSRPLVRLPEQARARDIDTLHFDTAFRGYRMDQVDDVLDQLQARLAAYEEQEGPATVKLKPRRPEPDPSGPA